MPSLLIAGKKPTMPLNAVTGPIPLSVSETWGQVHEAFTRLFYDGATLREWEAELDRMYRRVKSRAAKLSDRSLDDHPGRRKAAWEFQQWLIQETNLEDQIAELTQDLRAEALHVDVLWSQLPPEVQREIAEGCERAAPDVRELVLRLPAFTNGVGEVKRLAAWKALLAVWGSKHERCPF